MVLERIDKELIEAYRARPIFELSDIAAARRSMDARLGSARKPTAPPPGVDRKDMSTGPRHGDVRVRLYRPAAAPAPSPCLLWIHGGGFVLGELDHDDALLADLVNTVGCSAVAVDYRLAPEHPYPAALDDCGAALRWVVMNADQLGVDRERLAVGGTSSGAGIAAAVALDARDRGDVDLRLQLLIYPMLDDRGDTESSHSIHAPNVWSREANALAWQAYLNAIPADGVPEYAAPARAARLDGLPPGFIAVAELDILRDEDIDYARRLLTAGVTTELHVYAGAVHAFDRLAPSSGVAQRMVRDRNEALRRAFSSDDSEALRHVDLSRE